MDASLEKPVAERIKIEIILPSATSLWRVIVASAGIKSRQRVAWCGHMEAEAGRGDAVCLTAGTAGALSSLTCACEGEERANEGRQQHQQLDLHRGERWSLLLSRLLGRWRGGVWSWGHSLGAKSTTPEASHTPGTH